MPGVFGLAILIAPFIGSLGLVWMAEFTLVELLCFAAPAAVAARATTGEIRGALGLNWPPAGVLAGALLFGASFWYLNATLIAPLLAEFTSESDRALEGAIAEEYPLVLEALVIALVPALCEELLVRGAIARGLASRFGTVAAVLLSSGYFALLHLSVARALPTAVLGGFLALIVLRSGSVVPAILIHALNNTAALLLGDPSMAAVAGFIVGNPALVGPAALLGTGLGLTMMIRRR